jgi:mRNA-degrading endonuclease toxin of MazEF toxin-antitoxin module
MMLRTASRLPYELAAVAETDYGGVSLGEAVRRLIMEHHFAQINQRYEELRADQGGVRPAIVVGSPGHCSLAVDLMLVVPLTTRDRGLRHHVRSASASSGLHHPSWARTEELRAIATARLPNPRPLELPQRMR